MRQVGSKREGIIRKDILLNSKAHLSMEAGMPIYHYSASCESLWKPHVWHNIILSYQGWKHAVAVSPFEKDHKEELNTVDLEVSSQLCYHGDNKILPCGRIYDFVFSFSFLEKLGHCRQNYFLKPS